LAWDGARGAGVKCVYVQAARPRTATLHALVTELVRRKAEIDPEILEALRAEVTEVLAEPDEGIG
jgi:hypothetical protein